MSESSRNPISYSEAEKISFEIVPKTCTAVEKALDIDFRKAAQVLDEVLPKYRVEDSRELRGAFMEALGKITFGLLQDAARSVKYEATYPLRLALVQMIERELARKNKATKPSIYSYWIDFSRHPVKVKPDATKIDELLGHIKENA